MQPGTNSGEAIFENREVVYALAALGATAARELYGLVPLRAPDVIRAAGALSVRLQRIMIVSRTQNPGQPISVSLNAEEVAAVREAAELTMLRDGDAQAVLADYYAQNHAVTAADQAALFNAIDPLFSDPVLLDARSTVRVMPHLGPLLSSIYSVAPDNP